jgi:TPR repeat protein
MIQKSLQMEIESGADRKPGTVPAFLAMRAVGCLVLLVFVLATVGCKDDLPGVTAEEMQSDPMPEFDDAAFAGVWLSDGEYVNFERKEHGFYLLHSPAKKDGGEEEEPIPFRLKRAGNLLILEYWAETGAGKAYRPCWVGVDENAMELHCLLGEKLPQFGIEFETRKAGDDEIVFIRAPQERLKQLYQEQMLNEKVFEKTLCMTRPQPARVARLTKRAMKGNAEAQETLAQVYRAGEIVATDDEEARKWAQKAAESGRPSGEVLYADLLVEQARKSQDSLEGGNLNHEARSWYERAAEQRYRQAYSRLGHLYESSFYQDDSSAVDSYRRGADLGDTDSYAQLGIRYYAGKGLPQNERLALKYLEAVPEGSREFAAWTTLAQIYLFALEPELRDSKKALSAAERAEKQCGGCGYESHVLLARAYFENGMYERAVEEQENAAVGVTDVNDERVTALAYYRSFVPGEMKLAKNAEGDQ